MLIRILTILVPVLTIISFFSGSASLAILFSSMTVLVLLLRWNAVDVDKKSATA